ncbi:uncharacterized protein EI90DRAFT_3063346, partial [Cantharellus anzutake]|uniref:uncharacterized protein n=1 Tax=Cantharellus anzutake TaxID=1750568 RepID=UPI0019035337
MRLTNHRSGGLSSLQSAFQEPYRGETHKLLIETLNDHWRSGWSGQRPYNLSLSVIQSSGMGKSRMVHEAALSVFTIPINIREELGPVLETYPPPDKEFSYYFQGHLIKSDLRLQAEYAIILGVLFTKAAELLEKSFFTYETGAALASEWADYLNEGQTGTEVGTNRKKFLDSVVDRAWQLQLAELGVPQQNEGVQEKLRLLIPWMQYWCRRFIKAITGNDERARDVKCIVYFDDAHQLTEPVPPQKKNNARSHSPHDNLGTVLSKLIDFPVSFIFLSSSPHLQEFAPFPDSHPSVPIARDLPPFTELPFDIFVGKVFENLESQKKNRSLENVGQTGVMVGFGRGLWYVHHQNWVERKGWPVIPFARVKLIAEGNEAEVSHSLIAALGVRIGIVFDIIAQASRTMESKLIESHMRVVYAIPEHREFLHAGSPSEPILAEAAARHLNDPSNGGEIEIQGPEILAQAREKGLLSKGKHGELCGRLLVTIAHDIAVRQKYSLPDLYSPDPYFHRPVHVLDFLKALFAKQFEPVILDAHSVTAKADVPDLKTAFANAYIFFSHFALAKNSEMLSARNLTVALLRGMALQAKDNQESIDAVIPVHMGDPTKSISPESTSAINLKFKNRKEAKPCRVLRQITVPDEKVAVISIIFELGARKIGEPGLVTITKDIPHNTRSSASKLHWDDHHYEIVAHGCISETFAAIPSAVEPKYQSLLAAQTIVEDFPRAGMEENLRAFKNLKPFFDGLQEPLRLSFPVPYESV